MLFLMDYGTRVPKQEDKRRKEERKERETKRSCPVLSKQAVSEALILPQILPDSNMFGIRFEMGHFVHKVLFQSWKASLFLPLNLY